MCVKSQSKLQVYVRRLTLLVDILYTYDMPCLQKTHQSLVSIIKNSSSKVNELRLQRLLSCVTVVYNGYLCPNPGITGNEQLVRDSEQL